MAGITPYGFERKVLQDILTSMKRRVKGKLGDDWNVQTGSVEDNFISVFAEEADQIWQGVEGVYSSQTLNGAEGVYLDDVLSKQGVFRKGRQASAGTATIFSDYSLVTLGSTIPTTSFVTASNDLIYQVQEEVVLDNFMSAYQLSTSQLELGTAYSFTFYRVDYESNRTFEFTPVSELDKRNNLVNLAVFINDVILDKPSNAYYDEETETLYVGFNSATNLPNPFSPKQLYVSSTPRVGYVGHNVSLKATELGFNPLLAGELEDLSPSYTGYFSVVNGDSLSSGSEVQTDAEYRQAYLSIKDTSIAGTYDSIVSSLLELSGVVDAEIYQNPTNNSIYDVSSLLVNSPYTYNVVVLGGDSNDIAQVILEKAPLNTARTGPDTGMAINTKGSSVTVNFTRASYFDTAVNVDYTTRENTTLTDSERATISNNLITAMDGLRIGDLVPTKLLSAIVFQSVGFGRVIDVNITIKDLTEVGSEFTESDLTANHNEKPRVLLDQITFRRV